jgi:hypothetical protein
MEELGVIYQETQEKYQERCSTKDSRSERRSLKEDDDGLMTLREPESH